VTTGRSRLALFFVRAPAAIGLTLAFNAVALLIAVGASFWFADGLATPAVSLILQSAGWITLCNVIMASLAVGLGSLTASRALTLTALIGWQAVASQLLLNATSLGSVRDGLLTASLGQLMPVRGDVGVQMATGVALAVVAAWLLIPVLVGAWRTRTQDA
jgi:hypothetical protein